MPAPFPSPTRFAFIDALRGIACLGVACYHINRYGPLPEIAAPVIPDFLSAWFTRGWTGVQMFFVISGFVIAYSVRDARVTLGYFGRYAFRRSVRLDPPYWATIALVLLIHAVMSSHLGVTSPLDVPSAMETPLTWQLIVAHVFYLQNILGYDNLSAGFWALCIEFQFYLLVVAGIGIAQRIAEASKRDPSEASSIGLLAVFAPLALISLFYWNRQSENDMWVIHFFCMFFLGSAAWWALDNRIPRWTFWAYVAAMVARICLGWALDLTVALVTGVVIYLLGRAGKLTITGNIRPLQWLGRVSYSIYLVHFPIAHVVTTFGFWMTNENPSPAVAALWLFAALATSLIAAQLMYVAIEAPSVRLAARLKRSASLPIPARLPDSGPLPQTLAVN